MVLSWWCAQRIDRTIVRADAEPVGLSQSSQIGPTVDKVTVEAVACVVSVGEVIASQICDGRCVEEKLKEDGDESDRMGGRTDATVEICTGVGHLRG